MKRIAEIFSHFRNSDKETVLTPWRVVNLHLSNMVGGYCFLNEQFDSQEVLEEPRLVDQGQVTEDIFLNSEARILEMNSKSGLYPLYMAYSLYAMKLPGCFLPSVMSQYTPFYKAAEHGIGRRITTYEYRRVVNYAMDKGLVQGYMQQKSSAKEEYTPSFDLTGV